MSNFASVYARSQQRGGSAQWYRYFKDAANVVLRRLPYGTGKTFTCRALPEVTANGPQCFMYSQEYCAFTGFIRLAYGVRGWGNPNVSFLYAPADATPDAVDATPVGVFWTAANALGKNDSAFKSQYLTRKGDEGALITKPQLLGFMQVIVIQDGGEKPAYPQPAGTQFDDPPVVLEMSKSALDAFVAAVNTPRNPPGQSGDMFEQYLEHGDPIAAQGGRFITFYTLADGDPRARRQAFGAQAGPGNVPAFVQQAQQQQSQKKDAIGYGCFLEPTATIAGQTLPTAALMPRNQTDIPPMNGFWQRYRPWDDLLHVMSADEQLELLAARFPVDLLQYVFASHPAWLTSPALSAMTTRGFAQPMSQAAAGSYAPPTPQFGQPAAAGFGQPAASAPFGQPAMTSFVGVTAPATPTGQPAVASPFGQINPPQTFATQPAQSSPAVFGGGNVLAGQGVAVPTGVGQPAPASPFGQSQPVTTPSPFGQSPAVTAPAAFGQNPAAAAPSPFGQGPTVGATTPGYTAEQAAVLFGDNGGHAAARAADAATRGNGGFGGPPLPSPVGAPAPDAAAWAASMVVPQTATPPFETAPAVGSLPQQPADGFAPAVQTAAPAQQAATAPQQSTAGASVQKHPLFQMLQNPSSL